MLECCCAEAVVVAVDFVKEVGLQQALLEAWFVDSKQFAYDF